MSDRWPNLVGVEKGGSTSLWRYLDAHPDVFMSEDKEPGYLALEPDEAAKAKARYLSLFSGRPERWRGEASVVKYFYDELAPERILISLRNPLNRAYSAYLHTKRSGHGRRTFREAVEVELESRPAFDPAVADRIELDARNTFWHARNRLVELAMSSVRARTVARALVPDAIHARLDRYLLVHGEKPELDADLRRQLEALFEAERPALESLLGRRLPW